MGKTVCVFGKKVVIDKKLLQPIVLFGSLILGMGLAFVSSMLTTKFLTPSEFGNYKTIITIWNLLNVVGNFGLFHSSGQVLLKIDQNEKLREVIGTSFLVTITIGFMMTIGMILISKPIELIFKIPIDGYALFLAPLAIAFTFRDSLSLILQSTNRIFGLAILNSIPSLIFLLFLIFFPSKSKVTMVSILAAQQISLLFVELLLAIWSKPIFKNVIKWMKEILGHQKNYGKPVYIALVFGVATQHINRIAIAYWVNSQAIGYYSLASQLVEPIRLIPSSIATSSFREFASKSKITKKLLLITILFAAITFILFQILLGKPLTWFYPVEYVIQVSPISRALAFGAIILGFAELFNRYLGAHGKGNNLKISAYIFGAFNLFGFFILTPVWGVWGAVSSSLLACIVNLLLMLHFYKKSQKQLYQNSDENKGV